MELMHILSKVDHTLLSQKATFEDIKTLCDDGMQFGVASVCIPPVFVKKAAAYVEGRLPICTVIGFPNGYSTTETKCFEAENALKNGASELDMVIPIGLMKAGAYDNILQEITMLKKICADKILKVIIETCLLTESEKIKMCELVSLSGADYIKTSTGFSTGGATREDIALFARHVAPHVKIKAAGGIRSLNDAEDFINLGASRLGTSSIVRLVKSEHPDGY